MNQIFAVASLVVAATALSCQSTEPDLQLLSQPPLAPDAIPTRVVPAPPRAPSPPRALQVSAPKTPKVRRENVDEVFEDIYYVDAVPATFPFKKDVDVVLSVPQHTSLKHRAGLIGAFLAAGFPVKDAGQFNVASFHINDRPWWYDRGGFERTQLPEGVELEDLADLPIREYDGLSGMEISLQDPTSLWAPDLLANQNLKSDYFLRLFELTFDDYATTVDLKNLIDPAALAEYRAELKEVNAQIQQHNARVSSYLRDKDLYERDFATYLKQFESWDRDESRNFEKNQDAFVDAWKNWKVANADVIAAQQEAGIAEASWSRSKPELASFESPRTAVEVALPDATRLSQFGDDELERLVKDEQAATVQCRRLRLLAEVIDAKTGHVAWVGEAITVAKKGQPDAALLRETVRQLTQPNGLR
jgi:hypothetical protein